MRFLSLLLLIPFTLGLTGCNQNTPTEETDKPTETIEKETNTLGDEKEKFSYALGQEIGTSLKFFEEDVSIEVVINSIHDALDNEKESLLTAEEMQAVKETVFQRKREAEESEKKELAEANKKAAEEFLENNKNEEGVQETESGLQYIVLTEGDGEKPQATDQVKVHYVGTLLDGTEFDSSVARGEPITFPLNGVIPGWTEGVQLMNVGSKFKFFIHPEIAYGEDSRDPIPPNSLLIFEVELIEIIQPEETTEEQEETTEEPEA